RHDPACVICPLQHDCTALREGRVAELPTPRPGKPLPERQAVMLLLMDDDGRVLMQRRPPAGIWASLWSLPEADSREAARDWFDAHASSPQDAADTLDAIAHGFTHYRLTIQPLRWQGATLRAGVGDNDALRWVSHGALSSLGIPAPIRTLIDAQLRAKEPT